MFILWELPSTCLVRARWSISPACSSNKAWERVEAGWIRSLHTVQRVLVPAGFTAKSRQRFGHAAVRTVAVHCTVAMHYWAISIAIVPRAVSTRSVGANYSKLCTMAQFALCTTCCTSGCTILWKLCTIKCGQCTINNEQCKIVACTITCHITRDMQHFSTMQIVFASLFIWCKCCAWCSQQFSLSV